MNTNTPSPHALKAADTLATVGKLAYWPESTQKIREAAAIIQQAIDATVAERTRELREALTACREMLTCKTVASKCIDSPNGSCDCWSCEMAREVDTTLANATKTITQP